MLEKVETTIDDLASAAANLDRAIADLEQMKAEAQALADENELREALNLLLDEIEEHVDELPRAPRLRAAIRQACELAERSGNLIYIV